MAIHSTTSLHQFLHSKLSSNRNICQNNTGNMNLLSANLCGVYLPYPLSHPLTSKNNLHRTHLLSANPLSHPLTSQINPLTTNSLSANLCGVYFPYPLSHPLSSHSHYRNDGLLSANLCGMDFPYPLSHPLTSQNHLHRTPFLSVHPLSHPLTSKNKNSPSSPVSL